MYESPPIIAKIGEYLQEPLPDDPTALLAHIRGLEALRFQLAGQTVKWLQLKREGRARMLQPKTKEVTELDRVVMMKGSTASIEADYQYLLRVEDIVKDRLTLAGLLIRTQSLGN